MAISDLIGSPGFADDHLGFPSASWLSLGLAVTLSDSPAPPDLDLGVSVAPLAPPVLGGSRFPLRNHWNSSSLSRAASGLGCSSSNARPRRDYFGSSRYLFFTSVVSTVALDLSVLSRRHYFYRYSIHWWLLVFSAALASSR